MPSLPHGAAANNVFSYLRTRLGVAQSKTRPRQSAPPTPGTLVNRSRARSDPRIEFDLSEGIFVIHKILLQDRIERLGLLRAEIDTLEIAHVHSGLILLL